MKDLNMNCLTLNNSILYMTNEFGLKYYGEDFQMVWIDWEDDCLHYNLQINDDYWNIDQVYTALRFDMPSEVVHGYKKYELNVKEGEPTMNLKTFYKMQK